MADPRASELQAGDDGFLADTTCSANADEQTFFARYQAARRGARLYGYWGALEFDW
jgi:hypothetical protein